MASSISIIVPCYNEARTIEEILARLAAAYTCAWKKEIIVVDDASHDGTREILKKYENTISVIYCDTNGGKGTAVRYGLEKATGEYILIQDADLEYNPADIQALVSVIDTGVADVVYGSRTLSSSTKHGGTIARLGAWSITKLINFLYGLRLTDVWTCYKLFPRAASADFISGHFESELLFTAALARRQYRFIEVPISYAPRLFSEGKKIRYRDGIYAIIAIVVDWFRHI
ncbi:MAG: glycosyltransferase family 2 protein [bacterium]|nr:glycosyltransferase family 2 protein [bacterium]